MITDELLWEYIDGVISIDNKRLIEESVKTDELLAARLGLLIQMHADLLSNIAPEKLDPVSAIAVRACVLDSLVLPEAAPEPARRTRKHDPIVIGVFVCLLVSLLLALVGCFFERANMMAELSGKYSGFSVGFVVVIIPIYLFIDKYLHYRRTMRGIS